MKHLFAILLASAMVFAFAACSSSNDAPASQGTTEQELQPTRKRKSLPLMLPKKSRWSQNSRPMLKMLSSRPSPVPS